MKYLEKCSESGETRNKSLTFNTLELIRKFMVFDIMSLTSTENCRTVYKQILIMLILGIKDKIEVKQLYVEEDEE